MDREETIEILQKEIDEDIFTPTEYRKRIHEALDMAIESLSADRPNGEWVIVNKGLDIYICDQCGEVEQIQRIPIWDYCPNCGAKIKGERNECK